MSPDALYLTYYNPGDYVKNLYSFFEENRSLAPDWLVQKLKNLEEYDKKGLIVWPKKDGGSPRLKYYLEDNVINDTE